MYFMLTRFGCHTCSFEVDLEALGLPPGTVIDGYGSPRGHSDGISSSGGGGGGAASSAEVQALRDQVSALQVGHGRLARTTSV